MNILIRATTLAKHFTVSVDALYFMLSCLKCTVHRTFTDHTNLLYALPSYSVPDSLGLCRHRTYNDREASQPGERYWMVLEEPQHIVLGHRLHQWGYARGGWEEVPSHCHQGIKKHRTCGRWRTNMLSQTYRQTCLVVIYSILNICKKLL